MIELKDLILVFAIALVLGFMLGTSWEEFKWREDALENNVGEYYLDKDHDKKWRWRTK